MSFKYFVHKNNLKKKSTPNIKVYQILSSLYLSNVGIFSRDGPFEFNIGIINLHQAKMSHWVAYINEEIILIVMAGFLLKHYLNLL